MNLSNQSIHIFIIALLMCLGSGAASGVGNAFRWETRTYNGLEYVSLRSVKEFYYFDVIKYGSVITLEKADVKMELRPGSQQCRMNGLLFVLSHKLIDQNGRYFLSKTDLMKLVDPVLRPTHIHRANVFGTVVIDAGHGGKDSGSLGPYGNEKGYALKVARMVRDLLQQKGYRVVMTRDSDVFISLPNRVNIANKYRNAIFISIHFNSSHNVMASGIETFTISPVGVPHMGRDVRAGDFRSVPGNMMDSASIALATAVHSRSLLYLNNDRYGDNFQIPDRGIKRARFDVLTGIKIPAILFEGGFLSNRLEARKVHTPSYQKKLAEAIARAVDVYKTNITRR